MKSQLNEKTLFFPSHNEGEVFERCYRNNLPLLLKGPTGCGKSQLVQFMEREIEKREEGKSESKEGR